MKQVEITSKVVGRGESEGITSAIPSINLSGFALKSDLLTLEKKFSDFLNVPIIDGTINRWNELETFLAGISEDYNLLSLLNGKADKSYVDTNFVTIAGTEDVTGLHNFVNGLKIGGIEIVKKQDDVVYLDGNLVVRGGITMYGDGEGGSSVPSYSTLGSLLNVDESNDAVASVDRVLFQSAGSNVWSWKALSEIGGGSSGGGSVSGDYLPLSGGTMNDEASIKFQGSNTYGSSRWAIFAFGPSFQIKYGSYGSTTTPNGALEIANDGKIYNAGKLILTEANYSSYALPLSGGTLTGTLNTQFIRPSANAAYQCGTSSLRWDNVYSVYGNFSNSIIINGSTGIHAGNISSYNAGSATKLQTARTFWGQSFDGTGNVSGNISMGRNSIVFSSGRLGSHNTLAEANTINIITWEGKDDSYLGYVGYYDDHFIFCNYKGGTENSGFSVFDNGNITTIGNCNFGIRTASPAFPLHVVGTTYLQGSLAVNNYATFEWQSTGANPEYASRIGSFDHKGGFVIQFGKQANSTTKRFEIIDQNWTIALFYVDYNGNVLANGGITMYSDIRKKTILNHVELSLKQIADAPLIEHYYNSDQDKTTHVGSIAQYWAELNNWFCKLDAEGFYTMEIQNCALASAISIARHLEKYESKTDKKIRQLKKRISQLEDELELLKKGV